jgi:CheY-like chemotaxis protein/HPt (histidine-containing phosphotransfer) domain-containing protein
MLLESAGHRVDIAENGIQAVEAVRSKDYDAVLMDVQMPEMDGLDATRQIRAMPAPKCLVPIVMLTAHAMAGAREEYIAAGADEYLAKPVSSKTLLAMLEEIGTRESPRAVRMAQPDMETAPAIDFDAERSLPPHILSELIELYLLDMEQKIPRLKSLLEEADLSSLGREAHNLVATAGNVGAMKVSGLARQIEHACREEDCARGAALLDELVAASEGESSRLASIRQKNQAGLRGNEIS